MVTSLLTAAAMIRQTRPQPRRTPTVGSAIAAVHLLLLPTTLSRTRPEQPIRINGWHLPAAISLFLF
jgi:hypothetical protein